MFTLACNWYSWWLFKVSPILVLLSISSNNVWLCFGFVRFFRCGWVVATVDLSLDYNEKIKFHIANWYKLACSSKMKLTDILNDWLRFRRETWTTRGIDGRERRERLYVRESGVSIVRCLSVFVLCMCVGCFLYYDFSIQMSKHQMNFRRGIIYDIERLYICMCKQ